MTRQLFWKASNLFIEWLFRPPTAGGMMLKTGGALMLAALGFDVMLDLRAGDVNLVVKSGEGLAAVAVYSAYGLGFVLVVSGSGLALYNAAGEVKKALRQRMLVIEVRGLNSGPDTSAVDAELGAFREHRDWQLIDLRKFVDQGAVRDPKGAIAEVVSVRRFASTFTYGRDPRDVKLALGGLAAVPLLFLVGSLFDDEASVVQYDWDRDSRVWRLIDGADDGERFVIAGTPINTLHVAEVVVAVSASYKVLTESLGAAFPSTPVIHLDLPELKTTGVWSLSKLQALGAQFRQVLVDLTNANVSRVHLVLASPASLAIRMGMQYDSRLMPPLLVYQYERSVSPPYPWAIQLPSHGVSEPQVHRLKSAACA